jgi:hypothetical protein
MNQDHVRTKKERVHFTETPPTKTGIYYGMHPIICTRNRYGLTFTGHWPQVTCGNCLAQKKRRLWEAE